jgi:hypothetical protein
VATCAALPGGRRGDLGRRRHVYQHRCDEKQHGAERQLNRSGAAKRPRARGPARGTLRKWLSAPRAAMGTSSPTLSRTRRPKSVETSASIVPISTIDRSTPVRATMPRPKPARSREPSRELALGRRGRAAQLDQQRDQAAQPQPHGGEVEPLQGDLGRREGWEAAWLSVASTSSAAAARTPGRGQQRSVFRAGCTDCRDEHSQREQKRRKPQDGVVAEARPGRSARRGAGVADLEPDQEHRPDEGDAQLRPARAAAAAQLARQEHRRTQERRAQEAEQPDIEDPAGDDDAVSRRPSPTGGGAVTAEPAAAQSCRSKTHTSPRRCARRPARRSATPPCRRRPTAALSATVNSSAWPAKPTKRRRSGRHAAGCCPELEPRRASGPALR